MERGYCKSVKKKGRCFVCEKIEREKQAKAEDIERDKRRRFNAPLRYDPYNGKFVPNYGR